MAGPLSLNYSKRKLDLSKILRDNDSMMKQIREVKSSIPTLD